MDGIFQDFASMAVGVAILAVAALLVIMAIVSWVVSIVLAISYVKYNRRKNSAGVTGAEAARFLLDANGLTDIKVKATGSLLFGNSYGHYGKCVRIRRLTRNRTSLTALAIGAEKAALAILDREGDPDMKKRVRIMPLIAFGPFAFIPLLILGVVIDLVVANTGGIIILVTLALAVVLYVLSLVSTVITLRTEKKAQARSYQLLRDNNLATEDEIKDMEGLFKLYNVQYVNNVIVSSLELIYYLLRLLAFILRGTGKNSTGR